MIRWPMHLILAAAQAAIPPPPETQVAPAPAASTCIAIMLPSAKGIDGDATAAGATVRELIAAFLRGPSIGIVLLESRLAAHAMEEAREKSCGRILTAAIERKRGGGGLLGRIVGQAGTTAAWSIPGGTAASAIARGATVAAAQATAEIAASTKARDEMRLTFTLTAQDGRVELGPKTQKAKAANDGEDLVTPLVQSAAEAIAAKVSERRRERF
jgi:hypothetical protein